MKFKTNKELKKRKRNLKLKQGEAYLALCWSYHLQLSQKQIIPRPSYIAPTLGKALCGVDTLKESRHNLCIKPEAICVR